MYERSADKYFQKSTFAINNFIIKIPKKWLEHEYSTKQFHLWALEWEIIFLQ